MKLSEMFIIIAALCGIYMFVSGLMIYKQKTKKSCIPKYESRKLIDKEGYYKFMGKHYMTVGSATMGFCFVNFIFTKLVDLEIVFLFYAFIFLCICLRFIYCLCCKTDKFFKLPK